MGTNSFRNLPQHLAKSQKAKKPEVLNMGSMKFTFVSILVLSTNIVSAWLSARNHAVRRPQRATVRLSSSSLVEGPIHPASASDVMRDKLLSDANRAAWEQMVAKGEFSLRSPCSLSALTCRRTNRG